MSQHPLGRRADLRAAILVFVGALCSPAAAAEPTWTADLAALRAGVQVIESDPGSVPGPVLASGPAFPVIVGEDSARRLPVVTASRWGQGRVVAFGHGSFFAPAVLDGTATQSGRFITNAVRWVAGDVASLNGLRIGVVGQQAFGSWLRTRGADVVAVNPPIAAAQLAGLDVLAWSAWLQPASERQAIADYVQGGGGLVVESLAWGWLQLNPTRDIREHAGNLLLAATGIAWADGYSGRTHAAGYAATPPPAMTQASEALETLRTRRAQMSADEVAQAVLTLTRAIRTVQRDDAWLVPGLRTLTASVGAVVPTEAAPVTLIGHPVERLALALQVEDLRFTPPDHISAHPASASFPGAVPAGAMRVTRTVHVDTAQKRWHSTGLYAAPGELLTVTVAPTLANARLAIRIGAFTDENWHLDAWTRVPAVSLRRVLTAPTTSIASAFGGQVYVDVPDDVATLGVADVTIAGAVEAPYFRAGVTTNAAWVARERAKPAPWAEIGSGKIFITVPTETARTLSDPERLMRFWDSVADAQADLAARPRERAYPERFVADRQIAYGYMHAGYPLMTFLDVRDWVIDEPRLRVDPSWGHYHELGHTHQAPEWTFDGTGEVTVNLFTLYALEVVNGLRVGRVPTGTIASFTPSAIEARWVPYDAAGRRFADWKGDAFLALSMYAHLAKAFGWAAFHDVFAEYRALPTGERPQTDADKRDQWMVRMSRRVGRNLGPFFDAWGVPVSAAAKAQVSDLPLWADAACYSAADGAVCEDTSTCTHDDACRAVECTGGPSTVCKQPLRTRAAKLDVRDDEVPARDALAWSWQGGATTSEELGDPRTGDPVVLCVWDDDGEGPRVALELPGNAEPFPPALWSAKSGTRYVYKDRARTVRGVKKIDLVGGAGKTRAQLIAGGPALFPSGSPLPFRDAVRAQLLTAGACFDATFSRPRRHTAQRFTATSD